MAGNCAEPAQVSLAQIWSEIPDLATRGASGRIILAGSHVTRADLDMNWEVIGHTVKALGSRPCVDHLEEVVADFFGKTRPRGKQEVARIMSDPVCCLCRDCLPV